MTHNKNQGFVCGIFKKAVHFCNAVYPLPGQVPISGIFMPESLSLSLFKSDLGDGDTAINTTITCLNFDFGIMGSTCGPSAMMSDVNVMRK